MAKEDKEYTTEELVNMKVFTLKEARSYVEEKTGMGRGLFWRCIRPELEPKPMARDHRNKRPTRLVVLKKDVDRIIAKMKKKLLD